MGTGRRELEKNSLNLKKVFLVIVIIVMIIGAIYGIYSLVNSKDKNLVNDYAKEEEKEEIVEEKSKTIEEIISEFGGEISQKVKDDTYFISKAGKEYTAYLDGDIVEGRIMPWNGTSSQPAIDEAGNINIYNAEELRWVAEQVNNGTKNFSGVTITLRNNIDLGARKNNEDKWEGTEWTSIVGFLDELPKSEGKSTQERVHEEPVDDEQVDVTNENLKRFAGVFNGNNLWIRGMYINSTKRYQGLFGYQTGTISDLTLINSSVVGESSVAGIVGLNGGNILNCKLKNIEVSGNEKVGGIVGTTMTDSLIQGSEILEGNTIIQGKNYVGGIVGYMNNNSTISTCINRANVSGSIGVGGISGISFYGSTITRVSNQSKSIIGDSFVGGIIGYSQSQIEFSYNENTCSVIGREYVGGIAGTNYKMGNINSSCNKGKVIITEDNGGGIVGANNDTVSNCYNSGIIDAQKTKEAKIGGVCGQNASESSIYNSYNIGKIEYSSYAAGFVGADFGNISKCYYLDSTISNNDSSNVMSKTETDMKNLSSELGEEFVQDENNKNSGYPVLIWEK